jgi:hypothetical protein
MVPIRNRRECRLQKIEGEGMSLGAFSRAIAKRTNKSEHFGQQQLSTSHLATAKEEQRYFNQAN